VSGKVNSKFLSLVPDGWFRDYLDLMVETHNEMPLPFHFLTVAVMLGQMLGLETWAQVNKNVKIFPNINALLLAPASSQTFLRLDFRSFYQV